ncbi:hypothetical protein AJ79_07179 [Helicocarpus griseus UAMH5409]|uniref:C2H2-type domain-containing protein n=1 Tax=Helicocarpus griseus UAMH5409 TaxID=1447875 RepID=A0A2B7X5Z8_9EURO|nr:hypothetical protein AJ79_07179 [Helicocarpus griseus UAMH5409]
MGTALDALSSHQSLTSRRPAANNLPGFELLHPPQSQKYPLPNTNTQQQSRVSNLLTPPSNSSSDAGSISTTVSNTSFSSGQGATSYSQNYWPTANNFGSGMTNQPWLQSSFPSRNGFSPPSFAGRNNSHSPTTTDGLTPTFDINHRSYFHSPVSGASTSSGPSPTTQHPQPAMAHVLMNNAQATAATLPPTPPAQSNVDAYGQKLPSTPLYSGSQNTPHQAAFQPYQNNSAGSAMHQPSANGPSSRISPIQVQLPAEGQYSRPYPSYNLPAMSGPIMSNVHSPGSAMALMGSVQPHLAPTMHSGHAATMSNIYSGHPHHTMHGYMQQPQQDDRPYRCNECAQSFRRNHDLKRHTRIHLAVKPFPCQFCDKSFSRKDALKRHRLVKGCDKESLKDSQSDKTSSTTAPSPTVACKLEDTGASNPVSVRPHNISGNPALKSHT